MDKSQAIWDWLLGSDEPWTRYRTQLDLLDEPETDPGVKLSRAEMLSHPEIHKLLKKAQTWPGYPLKRHNDAKHPIQSLVVLADFGLRHSDPGMEQVVQALLDHQAEDGAFETLMHLYKRFGGLDGEHWVWMGCDAPVLLYTLGSFGKGELSEVQRSKDLLVNLLRENGWPCSASPKLGNFKGPGKREDPCPIATLQALKALTQVKTAKDNGVYLPGIHMLLDHWESQGERKYFLFGIGTDFRKIKYPMIWYDILHVVEVLSNFREAVMDPRFLEMVELILDQADDEGRYTASSMYLAWKGWSFADKKTPSPWLTFLVERIKKRAGI
jgi:hypothetical protein